jgi:hypothetical protein
MDSAYATRWARIERALAGVGLAGLAASALLGGCGGKVVVDTGAAAGGTGGYASGSQGGTGADGGAGCALTTTGAGGEGVVQTTECFAPPATGCPSVYQASEFITPMNCTYLVSVDCGPVVQGGACCYAVHEQAHPCMH